MQNMVNMQNILHMQNMYILFTQGGKDLDIHLVLRGISSSIQIVPLNQNKSDTNELKGLQPDSKGEPYCVRALHLPGVHPKEMGGV